MSLSCRVLVLAGSLLLPASAPMAQTPATADTAAVRLSRGFGADVREGVQRIRAATAPYHSLDAAVAAGYAPRVEKCYTDSMAHHGTMGYHHLNREHLDSMLVAERPEILLYERLDDGGYRLNGVEFIVPYRIWSRDSSPPKVFGLDLKREDNLNLWYLHAWVWTENPAGLFADWNPDVKCPD
jgi:hypothetical protein